MCYKQIKNKQHDKVEIQRLAVGMSLLCCLYNYYQLGTALLCLYQYFSILLVPVLNSRNCQDNSFFLLTCTYYYRPQIKNFLYALLIQSESLVLPVVATVLITKPSLCMRRICLITRPSPLCASASGTG